MSKNKKNKETWSKIRCALFFIVLYASWIIPCFMKYQEDYDTQKAEETIECTEDNFIRWKQESTETHIEALDIEIVAKACEPQFYNVPLSEELQLHIFEECEKYNIAPALIIAMIDQESDFDTSKIGDNGESFGLMQIQPKWHKGTMVRLGCNNLLDPFQNVTVGIAIVDGLKETDSDLYWVLMAYNGGEAYANKHIASENISDYAKEVVERASELESEYSND